MVEILANINKYIDAINDYNNLKTYNIFKKHKLKGDISALQNIITNTDLFDLLDALLFYVVKKNDRVIFTQKNRFKVQFAPNTIIFDLFNGTHMIQYIAGYHRFYVDNNTGTLFSFVINKLNPDTLSPKIRSIWGSIEPKIYEAVLYVIRTL